MSKQPTLRNIVKRLKQDRKARIVALACSFALIGLAAVQLSQAESFTIAYEAEIGTMEGNAQNAALFEADGTTPVTAVSFGSSSGDTGGDPVDDPGGDDGGDPGDDGNDDGGEPQDGTGPSGSGAIKHKKSGRCLDNDGAKTTVGNKIQLYDCFMSNAQKWTFKRIDGKAYSLLQVQGMCIHETGPLNNADVRLADCDSNSENQQWKWKDSEYIVNASNDRCLVPAFGGTANAANVVVANCDNSESQRWDMMDQDDAIPDAPVIVRGPVRHSSGRCMDNAQSKLIAQNTIQLWDCNGSSAQTFAIRPSQESAGYFAMPVAGTGFCVNSWVPFAGKNPDTVPIKLQVCDGRYSARWKKGPNGSIVNYETKRCLVPNLGRTTNGTPLVGANCNGSASQRWTLP